MDRVMWENIETFGCEYLKISSENNDQKVESTILMMDEVPHKVMYTLYLENWVTRKVEMIVDQHQTLVLKSDGKGYWFNGKDEPIEALKGAIDVDISATPFSNSLPINRHNWELEQTRDFEMVYISIPSLELKKVKQRYTFLEHHQNDRLFQYESGAFQSRITVDQYGLIVDYPELFIRKY